MKERNQHFIYPDLNTLASALVCEFSKFLGSASHHQRPLHLALSGGSTPLAIYRKLRETIPREEWSDISIYWGDERCVHPENLQSNFGQARSILLEWLDLPGKQVYRIRGEADPVEEAARYGRLLKEKLPGENGIPVFDWILLGLGEDGHTASIFPGQIELWNSDDPCVVTSHPLSGQKRISISGRVINAARRVSFIVSGRSKQTVVANLIKKQERYAEMPASLVAPASGWLEWYMDQEAASGL